MSDYPLFSVMGIEIEYMLVDSETLCVQPKSDLILNTLAGKPANEVALGEIAASNELVMHVLELKNNGPKPPTAPVAQQFQQTIVDLQPHLLKHNLQFLPTGAHPWMNPAVETRRWPHGDKSIYQQYDEIFNCQGHGWANLQSMHVNLPFSNDEEFVHLHSLIRVLLPLMPALAASSPILDGHPTGMLDSRLDFYSKNQQRIPSISGAIIPEFISSQKEYENEILHPMYRDVRPFDPKGILQHEWLNSRGAIAKFNSKAIEIRIIDSQECVNADIAIAQAVFAVLQHWYLNSQIYLEKIADTHQLQAVYNAAIKEGLLVEVSDYNLCEQWQLPRKTMTLNTIWHHLIERVSSHLDQTSQRTLEHILSQGNLSERILKACNGDTGRTTLIRVYRELGDCLLHNHFFKPF